MSDRVDEIRGRLEVASEGPWRPASMADLIAHAPTDITFLLDEVTRLTGALRDLTDAVKAQMTGGPKVTRKVASAHATARAALGGTDDEG